MSSSLKELKTSNKELRDKHDKIEKKHGELITRLNLLKDEYIALKSIMILLLLPMSLLL
jgi:hypothetical protein